MQNFRVVAYINGVRVYPESVSATFDVDSYASFSVTVPAIPDWKMLPPRSVVSVFYTDNVDDTWRLLVDGEYIGVASNQSSAGTQSRALLCRGHHAWATTQLFSTTLGAMTGMDPDKVSAQLELVANGFRFAQDTGSAQPTLQSVPQFFATAVAQSTEVTSMFRRFLRAVAYQSPVDAFYYKFRHLFDGIGAVPDDTIQRAFTNNRFMRLMDEWKSRTIVADQNQPVDSVLRKYLDMAFYRLSPLPAPPAVTSETDQAKIKSVFLIPPLYDTVPPASNVIFADQVVNSSETINWLAVPSRVTTRLSMGLTSAGLPTYYMSNDVTRSVNLAEELQVSASMLSTHGLFSDDELTRGVRNEFTSVNLTNAEQTGQMDSDLQNYIESMSRYNYMRHKGEQLRRSFQCVFLPYVMPGFPIAVENWNTGSIYGYVTGVTHTITQTGAASTTISVSHVRDLIDQEGMNYASPLPVWLNKRFKPDLVDQTYTDYFGVTSGAVRGKSAVRGFYSEVSAAHSDSMDEKAFKLDTFLSSTVYVPAFEKDGTFKRAARPVTIADSLRANADPTSIHKAMLSWQYRAGTSLDDYASAYGLERTIISSTDEPPLDLSGGKPVRAFSTPTQLLVSPGLVEESKNAASTSWYETSESDLSRAGVFLVPSVQYERQVIARAIGDRLSASSIELVSSPNSGQPLEYKPVTT